MTGAALPLAHQRCHQHPAREASARCPECKKPCCRECVTEHGGKVLCSACLRRKTDASRERPRAVGAVLVGLAVVFGVATAFLFFALAGEALLSLPASVHEGTIFHPELEPQ